MLDPTFQTVHPRTALWWVQREQCRRCAHCAAIEKPPGQTIWRCTTVGRGRGDTTCISARDEGQPCGPDAKMFKAGR